MPDSACFDFNLKYLVYYNSFSSPPNYKAVVNEDASEDVIALRHQIRLLKVDSNPDIVFVHFSG